MDQIIKNARQQQSSGPSKLNLITKNDLSNLKKRNDIMKRSLRRAVLLAHKEAETMKKCIQEERFGHFIVRASKDDNKYYNVLYKGPCMITDCRELFCEACMICFHKYKCECFEYSVKRTTCKHAHVVAMYKQERQPFLIASATKVVPSIDNQIPLIIEDEEISQEEQSVALNCNRETNMEQKRTLFMQQTQNYLNQMSGLDNNSFAVFDRNFRVFMMKNNEDLNTIDSKRKSENQADYPQEKRRKK